MNFITSGISVDKKTRINLKDVILQEILLVRNLGSSCISDCGHVSRSNAVRALLGNYKLDGFHYKLSVDVSYTSCVPPCTVS